jgi:hypothetical protein
VAFDPLKSLMHRRARPLPLTIEEAITLGTGRVAVSGVLSIGELRDHPWNEKGPHLYPCRRFFEAIARTFERRGRIVPVYSDKHLGPTWDDAFWMYQTARRLLIPIRQPSSFAPSLSTAPRRWGSEFGRARLRPSLFPMPARREARPAERTPGLSSVARH